MDNWSMFALGFTTGVGLTVTILIAYKILTIPDPTPELGALEVVEQLQRIAEGKTTIVGVYAAGSEGYEITTGDGWTVDLGWDDGWLTYVIRATSPDGRHGVHDTSGWPADPLEILEERDPALIGLFTLKVQEAIAERRRTFVTEG